MGRSETLGPDSAADEWNALALSNPVRSAAEAEELQASFDKAGILFAGAPMGSFLRPHFLSETRWVALRRASEHLLDLAARAARHAFDGDTQRLCAFLGTPAREAALVALDPGEPDVVLSRLDAFWTPDGPRFIEINSDAPAGFGYGDRMAGVFQALPLFQEFAKKRPVRYVPSGDGLVRVLLALYTALRGGSSPKIAILDWAEVKTRSDQEILAELFRAKGYSATLVDPREVVCSSGKLVGPGGPIDLVYRRLVLSELVARQDEVQELIRAYQDGLALFVNSFRCRLSEDKAFLALLTDDAFGHLFSAEEKAFLRRVVPWTRKIVKGRTRRGEQAIELIPYVLTHRNELVLKPTHGYGGVSVVVGNEVSDSEWEDAVLGGLDDPAVVQERVPIPEEAFPVLDGGSLRLENRKVNVNPFYAAGAEVGAVARASTKSVINVSAGGGSVPTFVTG